MKKILLVLTFLALMVLVGSVSAISVMNVKYVGSGDTTQYHYVCDKKYNSLLLCEDKTAQQWAFLYSSNNSFKPRGFQYITTNPGCYILRELIQTSTKSSKDISTLRGWGL